MIWLLWTAVAMSVLLHWLYRVNNEYYVLAFFARRIRAKDGRPLESIVPMPKGTTVFAHCFDLFGKDPVEVFSHLRRLSERFQNSYIEYSFGLSNIHITDAHNAGNVLRDPKLLTKGMVYGFLQPFLRTGVLTANEKKWHTRRNMLARTFNFDILTQFQLIFIAESLKFVHQFEDQNECIVSLPELIARFTLNSICETAMGVKLDEMAEKGDSYREGFQRGNEGFIKRLTNPLFWDDSIYHFFFGRSNDLALKVIHELSSEIISKRRILLEEELENRRATQTADDDICSPRNKPFAMLDTLICAEKDGLIDHIGISEEVDTLIAEGYHTTCITLVFGLLSMGFHADEQELCYQEIEEHIEDDLSNLNIGQLNKLRHLHYFLMETMRLYPSIPMIGRQTLEETELDNGLVLPKRCQINIHVFDIHRNPKYWDCPDEFRPERFLPENCQLRHPYAYIPFSAGLRNCIGQKYAMQEMKTLIVVILKQFRILPVTDPRSIVFAAAATLSFKSQIKVRLVRRKCKS
ncbi:probable cytochrome P450 4p2 [Drosophila biarmipes]|uniref:probable cytochrome P450 4p2 n=1 Tax=Drosophila biarmipes TaxID=125945 RepID=UPI001CDAC631|nr:probable cytochrome P450 4p2 [Drosophila biarmipes]